MCVTVTEQGNAGMSVTTYTHSKCQLVRPCGVLYGHCGLQSTPIHYLISQNNNTRLPTPVDALPCSCVLHAASSLMNRCQSMSGMSIVILVPIPCVLAAHSVARRQSRAVAKGSLQKFDPFAFLQPRTNSSELWNSGQYTYTDVR